MLNQVLVKCSLSDVKKYLNKKVKGIYNNKEVILYFRVVCDETNIIETIENCTNVNNVVAIEYKGDKSSPCYCCLPPDLIRDNYIMTIYKVSELNEIVVKDIISKTPNGIVPIIKLDESYNNLETIWRLNKIYPKVRFCGGNLFCIKDCNIGCCGIDILQKKNIDYDIDAFYRQNPCNCALTVCELKDITGISVVKETEISKIEHNKNVEQKQVLFSDLLSDLL